MNDLFDKLRPLKDALRQYAATGPVPFDTVIEASRGPVDVTIAGRPTIVFGSNNYLGLTHHPDVLEAGRIAAERWGAGTTGSRVANGSLALHAELEADFARVFGKRHAMVFTTGHQANLSLLTGLCNGDDVILLDAESHASIFDGARLSGATTIAFRHNLTADLEKKLARLPKGGRNRLVVVEGIYSTSGDTAPIADIVAVAKANGTYVVVDEAHSFGVVGPRGLGRAEAEGVLGEVDFVVGTFSKALGGVGGFVVSDHAELKALHFAARAYLFTASPSPWTVASARAALAVFEREPGRRDVLWQNVRRWREGLRQLGLATGTGEGPIVPVYLGRPESTVAMWRYLLERGIYVNLVLPPGCAASRVGLRTSVSAAHEANHLERGLDVFSQAVHDLGELARGPTNRERDA